MPGNDIHLLDENVRANPESESPRSLPRASGTPMQSGFKLLVDRWKYLRAQESFRRAPLLTVCRLICWRARCLLQKPAVINLPEWNVRMFLPPEWRGIGKLVFAFREDYEPELACLREILWPGNVFIDAGANVGIYTLA